MTNAIKYVKGDFFSTHGRYAIICAQFNAFIVNQLEAAAIDTLQRHGTDKKNITVYYVPGAHELPIVAQRVAESNQFDAIIALGAVIRGSTAHFEMIANEQAKGLGHVALQYNIPVLTGVLTTNTIEQAIERAGTKAGNKGHDAAMAALEMVSLLQKIAK